MYTSKTRTLSGVMAGLILAGGVGASGVGLLPGTTNTALALDMAQKKVSQEKLKEIQGKKEKGVRLFTNFVKIEGALRNKEEIQKFLEQNAQLVNGLQDKPSITKLLEREDPNFSLEYLAKVKEEGKTNSAKREQYEKLNQLTLDFDNYVRKSAHLYIIGRDLAKYDSDVRFKFNTGAKIGVGVAAVAYVLEQQIAAYLALAGGLVSAIKGSPSRTKQAEKLTAKLGDNASMALLYVAPDNDPAVNNLSFRKEAAIVFASGLPLSATAIGFAQEIDDQRRNNDVTDGKLETLISKTAFTSPTIPPLGLNVTQYRNAVERFADLLVEETPTSARLEALKKMDISVGTRTVNLGALFEIHFQVLDATIKDFGEPEWKADNASTNKMGAVEVKPVTRTARNLSGNFYTPDGNNSSVAKVVIPISALIKPPQLRYGV